jgi:hypothetical protein
MASNVTQTLETIWGDVGVNVLGAAFPALGAALKIPIIGSILTDSINAISNWLIKNGVIEIKTVVLDVMSSSAQAKWSKEVALIKTIQKGGLSAAQQAEYDQALQALVNSHGGIVNA